MASAPPGVVADASPQGIWANFEAAAEAKQHDQVIRLLDRAVDAGFDDLKLLRTWISFAEIQSDPRFVAIVKRTRANGCTTSL